MIIAKNFVHFRERGEFNQKIFTELLELKHQNRLSEIECGHRDAPANLVLKAAKVLNINPDCLFEVISNDAVDCNEIDFNNDGQQKFYEEWKSASISDKEQMLKIMDNYIDNVVTKDKLLEA